MCSISALIGAKPVPEASSTIGLLGVLAQEEAAVRALDALDLLFLHGVEDMVGELAARHVADVQLQAGAVCAARWPSSSCAGSRRAA
jgi:hypothetical protein